jgi:hypothetical protein
MAYASVAEVKALMNRSDLVDAQIQVALDAATEWIDAHSGRTYYPVSPVTEVQTVWGPTLYLKIKPVATVTSVSVRSKEIGSNGIALDTGSQFELLDSRRGIVRLGSWWPEFDEESIWHGYQATIVYTHELATPANIKLACVILAAHWMTTIIMPESLIFESLSEQQSVSMRFKSGKVPEQVHELIQYRKRATVV